MDRPRVRDESRDAQTVRAFFALEPAPPARGAAEALVGQLRERPGGQEVRWVKGANLHVTMRFLGQIATARIPELLGCVGAETRRIARLRLRLGTLRIFPSERRPRVVSLDVEPAARLETLAAAVERGVRAAGFAPESRRFRPHLTLGRIPPRADLPSVTAADTPAADPFTVTELILFRSDLRPSGPRYSPLGRVPLQSAP